MDDYTATGWIARFTNDGKEKTLPVIRWDAMTGDAQVPDEDSGRLVAANQIPGFRLIDTAIRIVGTLPAADGWRVRFHSDHGDRTSPIVGWIVTGDGDALPICPTGDGSVFAQLGISYTILLPE